MTVPAEHAALGMFYGWLSGHQDTLVRTQGIIWDEEDGIHRLTIQVGRHVLAVVPFSLLKAVEG